MTKKKSSFEEKMKQLDAIVDLLDSGDAPLEELLDKFEHGMKIAKELREFLNKAELKVVEITKENSMKEEFDDFDETENLEDEIGEEFDTLLVDDEDLELLVSDDFELEDQEDEEEEEIF